MKRGLILVEGPTEKNFVDKVLAKAFAPRELFLDATILVTKPVKDGPDFTGGVSTYAKFRKDIGHLLRDRNAAVVTMILDYYGLPADFPGMSTRPGASPLARATHVEDAIRMDLGQPRNFIPFLALHEFEAWLFSSRDELPQTMHEPAGRKAFAAIRDSVETPEDIDEGFATAPSRRIKAIFPAYSKPVHGPLVAESIGLDHIRAECPHFDAWVRTLESFCLE